MCDVKDNWKDVCVILFEVMVVRVSSSDVCFYEKVEFD